MDLSCNLILLILLIFDGKEGKCGIPILTWLIGFFIILAFKTILKGFTIFFIEANPQVAQRYVILSTFSSDMLLILWLIYGNMLFYSDKNDCDKREGTTFEFYLMFIFLLYTRTRGAWVGLFCATLLSLGLWIISSRSTFYQAIRSHFDRQAYMFAAVSLLLVALLLFVRR